VPGFTHVNSRATQGLEAPPRTSASHLASDPQSWPELSMATRPGQRTLEAARRKGYAPVRGTPVMMMMMNTILHIYYKTVAYTKFRKKVQKMQKKQQQSIAINKYESETKIHYQ